MNKPKQTMRMIQLGNNFMKIVINTCYGGFNLSKEAVLLYAKYKGIELYPEDEKLYFIYYLTPKERRKSEKDMEALYPKDIERDDPILVKVVEELGEKANNYYSNLKVVEIPDGVAWEIDEYDGIETIHEKHATWS